MFAKFWVASSKPLVCCTSFYIAVRWQQWPNSNDNSKLEFSGWFRNIELIWCALGAPCWKTECCHFAFWWQNFISHRAFQIKLVWTPKNFYAFRSTQCIRESNEFICLILNENQSSFDILQAFCFLLSLPSLHHSLSLSLSLSFSRHLFSPQIVLLPFLNAPCFATVCMS